MSQLDLNYQFSQQIQVTLLKKISFQKHYIFFIASTKAFQLSYVIIKVKIIE